MGQVQGVIKRLVRDRGFGFVRDANGKNEYFFHRSSVRPSFDHLNEGDAVTFDVGKSDKGPRAENVTAD